MNIIPHVIEFSDGVERSFDLYSRLLKDRIILMCGEINDNLANLVVASLLYLESENNEKISLYINSIGGSVNAGLQIIDTMNYIKSPVETICLGSAMSMAAVILLCGEKNSRYALENSEIMIHQPSGGFEGTELDVQIYAKRLNRLKGKLYDIISTNTKMDKAEVLKKSERDCFLTSTEALELGIIDKILKREE